VHFVQWLFVVIAAVASVGCASPGTSENARTQNAEPRVRSVWTADGMYLVRGRAGALCLTPSPLDLSRYSGVLLEEIQISTKRRSRDLKPSEEERLTGYFTRRLVLRVRLSVRDVELPRFRRSHFGVIISGVSSDEIKIALELRDAVSSDRRLLFGDRRGLPFGAYAGSDSVAIRRVEDAFYDFSIDIRRRLRQVQRGDFPPPPRPS